MSKVCDAAFAVINPIVTALGMEIVDIEYKKQYDQMNLTIFIDKEGGISLDDCEKIHNAIDAPLDELDPTKGERYVLNVSSAGLDRPLKTEKDFNRKMGTEIEISLYSQIDGKKKYEGILSSFDSESVSIIINEKEVAFNKKNIAAVKPVIRF